MPIISSHDGCELNVVVEGPTDAPAIILSHYLGGTLETFDAQLAVLTGKRRIVRFDTRGHGRSGAPAGEYSNEMLGRDALTILDTLHIASADFLGVSQGGMTGMWLAVHHSARVRRLVLANTTPFIPNKPVWGDLARRAQSEGMTDIARATISDWLSEGFRARNPERVDALIGYMAAMPVTGYVGNTSVLRDIDLRDALQDISAPTLVIGGAEDGPRGASAPVMAATMQAGRLAIIPEAAHLSHIENPTAFNAEIVRHFDL